MGFEELDADHREVGDLALAVLELDDLRVPLMIVEVVDRAHRKFVMQVLAHRGDLRLGVVQEGLLRKPPVFVSSSGAVSGNFSIFTSSSAGFSRNCPILTLSSAGLSRNVPTFASSSA